MEQAQRLVYANEDAVPDLCYSLSCRPVMEVGWNVKLPVNVCALHRCCPTSPAKQDGWGSVLPPQNIWFSFTATGERKKKMNEEGFLKASNCCRDKPWSGSKQTAVLFNASCSSVDGLFDWRKLAECDVVVFPRCSLNLECCSMSTADSFSQLFLASVSLCFFFTASLLSSHGPWLLNFFR